MTLNDGNSLDIEMLNHNTLTKRVMSVADVKDDEAVRIFIQANNVNLTKEELMDVPVRRDTDYRRFSPNTVSTWAFQEANGPVFRLMLQSIEVEEVRHYIDPTPGADQPLKKKDIRLEVVVLGEVVLGLAQARQLRDDLDGLLNVYSPK